MFPGYDMVGSSSAVLANRNDAREVPTIDSGAKRGKDRKDRALTGSRMKRLWSGEGLAVEFQGSWAAQVSLARETQCAIAHAHASSRSQGFAIAGGYLLPDLPDR